MRDTIFGNKVETEIIGDERVAIEYQLYALGNQTPRFSITGEVRSKYARKDSDPRSCGQCQDRYARWFKNVRLYNKWHLTGLEGPIHYVANTVFWFERGNAGGDHDRYSNHSAEWCYAAAEHACVWGALDGDWGSIEEVVTDEQWNGDLKKLLSYRLKPLQAAFQRDMVALFGQDAWDAAVAFEEARLQAEEESYEAS